MPPVVRGPVLVRVGETRTQGVAGHQDCRRPVPERAHSQDEHHVHACVRSTDHIN